MWVRAPHPTCVSDPFKNGTAQDNKTFEVYDIHFYSPGSNGPEHVIQTSFIQSRGQVGTGEGVLEVENQVPTKKEIGAKVEHQRRQKKKDRKTETGKTQREGEVGLGNLITTPPFLKNQVNVFGVYELSLLVLISSLSVSFSHSPPPHTYTHTRTYTHTHMNT